MAQMNVTVNGKPLEDFLAGQKAKEIRRLYYDVLRESRRGTRRPIISRSPVTTVTERSGEVRHIAIDA